MKKISKKLENMKLNRKFTITILIFVMIPMGVILGVLFYNMVATSPSTRVKSTGRSWRTDGA